jgi:tRNA threonylcarbamoyl adenosine modification protein YjeE
VQRTFATQVELEVYAAAFARTLRAGDAIGLSGPLGAGKTTFVRAAVRALHGNDPTTSPTFTFWHRYAGTPPIDHLDFYRIERPEELDELGLDEAFDGSSIVFVEWWRNAPSLLPGRRYEIAFEGSGDSPRKLEIAGPV